MAAANGEESLPREPAGDSQTHLWGRRCGRYGCWSGERPLTLQDLYVLALTNDPTFQSATFTFQSSETASNRSFSALLPSHIGKTKYTDVPLSIGLFDADQWVLQLTQPLFEPNPVGVQRSGGECGTGRRPICAGRARI